MDRKFSEVDIPSLIGKIGVVTGGNSGLGFQISKVLSNHGVHVIMACRNESKAKAAVEEIRSGKPRGEVEARSLDLASLESVANFADQFRKEGTDLHLLINNAGLMAIDQEKTVDGFEMQFQVNYLSHFALTAQLMPVLLRTPQSRVVSMSSSAHRRGKIDFEDLMYEHRKYSRWGAYAQSKLAILLFIAELNRQLGSSSSTMALAAHPGVARTRLGQNAGGLVGYGFLLSAPLVAQSAYKGAMPAIRAATDPAVKGGQFFGPRHAMMGDPVLEIPSLAAQDTDDAIRLWNVSERLIGRRFSTLMSG